MLRIGLSRNFVYALVVIAIISSAISPACAFISGKYGDWVEICSGLQTERIQTQQSSEVPDLTQSGCEFCYQNVHASAILTNVPVILPLKHMFVRHDFVSEQALINFVSPRRARAPPFLS